MLVLFVAASSVAATTTTSGLFALTSTACTTLSTCGPTSLALGLGGIAGTSGTVAVGKTWCVCVCVCVLIYVGRW